MFDILHAASEMPTTAAKTLAKIEFRAALLSGSHGTRKDPRLPIALPRYQTSLGKYASKPLSKRKLDSLFGR
jgi:hypothetical protein